MSTIFPLTDILSIRTLVQIPPPPPSLRLLMLVEACLFSSHSTWLTHVTGIYHILSCALERTSPWRQTLWNSQGDLLWLLIQISCSKPIYWLQPVTLYCVLQASPWRQTTLGTETNSFDYLRQRCVDFHRKKNVTHMIRNCSGISI